MFWGDRFDGRSGPFAWQIRDGARALTRGAEAMTSSPIRLIGLDRARMLMESVASSAPARKPHEPWLPGRGPRMLCDFGG